MPGIYCQTHLLFESWSSDLPWQHTIFILRRYPGKVTGSHDIRIMRHDKHLSRFKISTADLLVRLLMCGINAKNVSRRVHSFKMTVTLQVLIWDTWLLRIDLLPIHPLFMNHVTMCVFTPNRITERGSLTSD